MGDLVFFVKIPIEYLKNSYVYNIKISTSNYHVNILFLYFITLCTFTCILYKHHNTLITAIISLDTDDGCRRFTRLLEFLL